MQVDLKGCYEESLEVIKNHPSVKDVHGSLWNSDDMITVRIYVTPHGFWTDVIRLSIDVYHNRHSIAYKIDMSHSSGGQDGDDSLYSHRNFQYAIGCLLHVADVFKLIIEREIKNGTATV